MFTDWYMLLGIISGLVFAGGNIPYILEIRKGTIRPNLASWIGWFFLLVIGSTAQIAEGASWSVLLPIGGAIGDGITTYFVFKYGYTRFSLLDKACLFLGALGIFLWLITSEPLIALVLAILADFMVATPTIVKTFKDPSSEPILGWLLFALGSLIAIGATGQVNFNNLAYPIALTILNSGILLLALRGKMKKV
ncbi:MAG TPA: hypothetical protein VJI74_01600 [Candidatus Paceibacterota bacterium]